MTDGFMDVSKFEVEGYSDDDLFSDEPKKIKKPSGLGEVAEVAPSTVVETPSVEIEDVQEVQEVEEVQDVEEFTGEDLGEPDGEKGVHGIDATASEDDEVPITETQAQQVSITPELKFVNGMCRKGDTEDIPQLFKMMGNKQIIKVKISDIAVFTEEPQDEILKNLFEAMPHINKVNLSAGVDLKRVKLIGSQIFKASSVYQVIQVARIKNMPLQCTSGRHRLVFLALVYGANAEVDVCIEDMTLSEARDAVVFANQSRKAKAMEKAEHAVLQAVCGDVNAEQEKMFSKTAKNKSGAMKYAIYSVFERGNPAKFSFNVTNNSTRGQDDLTTITSIESYWRSSLVWNKSMTLEDFNKGLEFSVLFLNNLVTCFNENEKFEPIQHMASMTLNAIGKYLRTMEDAGVNIDIQKMANVIVSMGEVGRQKSSETYDDIVLLMKNK
jgi:hypothetical protein